MLEVKELKFYVTIVKLLTTFQRGTTKTSYLNRKKALAGFKLILLPATSTLGMFAQVSVMSYSPVTNKRDIESFQW